MGSSFRLLICSLPSSQVHSAIWFPVVFFLPSPGVIGNQGWFYVSPLVQYSETTSQQDLVCVCVSSRWSALWTELPGRRVPLLREAVGAGDRRDAVWPERVVAVRGRKVYGRPTEERQIAKMGCSTTEPNTFFQPYSLPSCRPPDNNLREPSFCRLYLFFNQMFGVSASSVVCVGMVTSRVMQLFRAVFPKT